MRIGVTGYKGMVGQELLKYPDVVPLPCDVRMIDEVEMAVRNTEVDLIVHLASITDVDKCEKTANLTSVKATNIEGTMNVCEVAERHNCGVTFLSTFQVFDGRWGNYKEKSKPHPVNMYGLSKMTSEAFSGLYPNMKVIRAGYLFDRGRMFGDLNELRRGKEKYYPTFMERSFMYLPHFVEALYFYLLNWDSMPTMLHIAGSRPVTWFEFMKSAATILKLNNEMVRPRKYELQGVTPRPHWAGLNVGLSKKLGIPQYNYLDGLFAMRELM